MNKTYYLGPVGRMVALPVPDAGFDNSLKKYAAVSQGLSGRRTAWVMGFRREWELEVPMLNPDEVGFIEACYLGVVPGPLKLYDPLRKNKLSAPVSTGLSRAEWNADDVPFKAGSGSTASGFPALVSTDSTYPATAPLLKSFVSVVNAAGSAGVIVVDQNSPTAVLPNTAYTLSFWAKAVSGSMTVQAVVSDAAGTVLDTQMSPSVASTTWLRRTVSFTTGATAATVQLSCIPSAASEVRTTAWQLEEGTSATAWVPGTGVPEVRIDDLGYQSDQFPLNTLTIQLQEV